jgi:hypothetical protein
MQRSIETNRTPIYRHMWSASFVIDGAVHVNSTEMCVTRTMTTQDVHFNSIYKFGDHPIKLLEKNGGKDGQRTRNHG